MLLFFFNALIVIKIYDNDKWFDNLFISGPGFQMVQIFVESIFEKHVDWMNLIQNDDNFKNILQVKIQKNFKVTPHYMDIEEYNAETGYHMGVFLCLGQQIHETNIENAYNINEFNDFNHVKETATINPVLILLGKGIHKIKKKAEQDACKEAISKIQLLQS